MERIRRCPNKNSKPQKILKVGRDRHPELSQRKLSMAQYLQVLEEKIMKVHKKYSKGVNLLKHIQRTLLTLPVPVKLPTSIYFK